MSACLFPGSFDPPTNGHLDLVERLAKMFDTVYVCVIRNSEKKPFLPEETRVELFKEACAALPNVQVVQGTGFTVDMAKKCGAAVIARGVRNSQDYIYESQLAKANAYVDKETETVFLLSKPEHEGLSSSIVREIWSLNGDISALVPGNVLSALEEKRRAETK